MAGYAELFDVERFQLMGVSAEDIGFHWPAAQVK